jgi:hypothetical protein
VSDPRTEWAERLGAKARATPDEARAAFLRGLPGADFAPDAGTAAALNALAGTAVPVSGEAARAAARAEVAAFAAGFWELEPPARRAAWEELRARVDAESGADRLRALEPGLAVVTDPLPHPDADELAALVRELFVLPPRARGLRRNEWLAAHAHDTLRWCGAHHALRDSAPEVLALEPQLAAVLSNGAVTEAFADGFAVLPLPEPEPLPNEPQEEQRAEPSEYARAQRRAAAEAADSATSGTIWRSGWWILLVVIFVVRLASTMSGSGSSSTVPPPKLNWSPQPALPDVKTGTFFSSTSIAEFERYERDKTRPLPAQYTSWVLMGRPRTPGYYNFGSPTRP